MADLDYKDKWLQLIGIPSIALIIVHIGNDNSISWLMRNPGYYTDILYALLAVALSWIFVRKMNMRLDRYKSWVQAPLERALLQFGITVFPIVLLVVISESIYLEFILNIRVRDSSLWYYELPMTIVFVVLVNLIYTVLHLLGQATGAPQSATDASAPVAPASNESVVMQRIIANRGSAQFPLAIAQIAYIFLENDIIFARTFDGQQYLLDYSLDKLTGMIDPNQFFRANRQFIVNVKAVEKYQIDSTRNLLLQVIPSTQKEITVNKNNVAAFKAWLQKV